MNPCLTILLSLVPSLHLVGICPPCQAVRSLSIWLQSRNPSGEPWKETPSNQPRGRGLRAFALRKLRELLPQSPHGCIVVLIPPARVLVQCHLCLHFRAITNRFLPSFSLTSLHQASFPSTLRYFALSVPVAFRHLSHLILDSTESMHMHHPTPSNKELVVYVILCYHVTPVTHSHSNFQ